MKNTGKNNVLFPTTRYPNQSCAGINKFSEFLQILNLNFDRYNKNNISIRQRTIKPQIYKGVFVCTSKLFNCDFDGWCSSSFKTPTFWCQRWEILWFLLYILEKSRNIRRQFENKLHLIFFISSIGRNTLI